MAAQSTIKYEIFKFLNGNRRVNEGHVLRLGKSIGLRPELLAIRPILVNDKMEVIDGQHRLEAAKRLNVPIYYEVQPDLSVEETIAINRNQLNWGLKDFALSYADQGVEMYQKFLDLAEEFPTIAASTIIAYMAGGETRGLSVSFREGKLEMPDEVTTRRYLEMLEELIDMNALFRRTRYGAAMLQIFKNENYDHRRMVKKLIVGEHILRGYVTVSDILRNLEEVYNYRQTEAGITRLF